MSTQSEPWKLPIRGVLKMFSLLSCICSCYICICLVELNTIIWYGNLLLGQIDSNNIRQLSILWFQFVKSNKKHFPNLTVQMFHWKISSVFCLPAEQISINMIYLIMLDLDIHQPSLVLIEISNMEHLTVAAPSITVK